MDLVNKRDWKLGLAVLFGAGFFGTAACCLSHAAGAPISWSAICIALASVSLGFLAWLQWKSGQSDKTRDDDWEEIRDICLVCAVISATLAIGFYAVYAFTGYLEPSTRTSGILALILWGLAAFAIAFLLGFLFGIPKVIQTGDEQGSGRRPDYRQTVNTNLEQISDWLTKIIVGLGLVQLYETPKLLERAAKWVAACLPTKAGFELKAESLASSLIIVFGVLGFLAGYLLTRLYLAGAFRRADAPRTPSKTENQFGQDDLDVQKRLQTFLMPDGKHVEAENEKQLVDWLRERRLQCSWATFLSAKQFTALRAEAVEKFKL